MQLETYEEESSLEKSRRAEELADYIDTLPFRTIEDYLNSKQFEKDASTWAREGGWREPE